MYDPYQHAEDLNIEIIHRPIRTANGLWIPEHNLIVLKQGMRAVWDRSTLAHELGHACLAHCDDRPKHEVQADRFAAANMIDSERARELMNWVPDAHKLAAELEVTTRLLRTWLNVNRLAG